MRLCHLLRPLVLSTLLTAAAASTLETPWIEPSLCRAPDALYNRYVAFEPNKTTGAPPVGTASPTISSCDANVDVGSSSQSIELGPDMVWPNGGTNLSLQVFRGDSDCVVLSLALRDAVGLELFTLDKVQLGTMPAPRNWSHDTSADGDDDVDEAELVQGGTSPSMGRRLLFSSHGQRRLLKGGSTSGAGSASRFGTGSRTVAYRGSSSGVSAWGAHGAVPMRTGYGYSAHHVVMAGTMVYLMHRRGYAGACPGVHSCEV